MKHKIFSFFAAVLMTGGLFVAAPMAPPASAAITQQEMKTFIEFCSTSFRFYRMGDEGVFFKKHLQQMPEEARPVVQLVCASYGQGWYDGRRESTTRIASNTNSLHVFS